MLCLDELLRMLLRYERSERATASEGLASERVKNWALPELASVQVEVRDTGEALAPEDGDFVVGQISGATCQFKISVKKMVL